MRLLPRSASGAAPRRDLVGRDLARVRIAGSRAPRPLAALLIGALVAGMGLAALRIDILRLRYALARAVETEKTLLEDQRVWTARKESLRDPSRLAALARERGFERPRNVIDLRPLRLASSPRP
jgi:hypothetical protein